MKNKVTGNKSKIARKKDIEKGGRKRNKNSKKEREKDVKIKEME